MYVCIYTHTYITIHIYIYIDMYVICYNLSSYRFIPTDNPPVALEYFKISNSNLKKETLYYRGERKKTTKNKKKIITFSKHEFKHARVQ